MVKPDIRLLGIGAMIAPLLFGIMWLAAAMTDGQWVFGQNTLSTLGISENAVAAAIFNSACVISGILGILFGIFRYEYENKPNRIGSIALIIGMFLLALVGTVTKAQDTHTIHVIIATCFGAFWFIAMLLSVAGDKRYRWIRISTVILIIFCAVMIMTQKKAMWEAWIIIAGNVWIVLQGVKYTLYSNDFATEGGKESD